MRSDWKRVRLGDHINTQKGFAFKSKWYTDSGRSIVKVSNFTADSVDVSSLVSIPEEIAASYLRYELSEDDVVIQTVGSWPSNPQSVVGKAIRVPRNADGALLNQNAVKIIPGLEFDKSFLFYLLRSENFKEYIVGTAQGAASQASITLDSIRYFAFDLPPKNVQSQIAAILSTYDDLIENNLRRIKILEEMAQNLYREWFVKFRFPGHEKVRMVDSSLGKIPGGWGIGTINDVVDVKSGFAFKSKSFVKDGDYSLVTIKNVKDGLFIADCESQIDDLPSNMPAYCHLTTGDILLSLTGNVGRACLIYGKNYLLNQRVSKLIPKAGVGKGFVYFTFRQAGFRQQLEMIATGVAQQNLSPVKMGNMEFAIPSEQVLSAFGDYANVVVDTIISLNLRNKTLRQTRDLLLPKFISGELDVSELPIATGQEAA